MHISSQNPIFDHLLESSRWDDTNKWSNIGFGEEITEVESIEVNFKDLIWNSEIPCWNCHAYNAIQMPEYKEASVTFHWSECLTMMPNY